MAQTRAPDQASSYPTAALPRIFSGPSTKLTPRLCWKHGRRSSYLSCKPLRLPPSLRDDCMTGDVAWFGCVRRSCDSHTRHVASFYRNLVPSFTVEAAQTAFSHHFLYFSQGVAVGVAISAQSKAAATPHLDAMVPVRHRNHVLAPAVPCLTHAIVPGHSSDSEQL